MPKFLACPQCGVARLLMERCVACGLVALPVPMTGSAAQEVREAYRARKEVQEAWPLTPEQKARDFEMFFGPKEW